jgi:DNA invertase Pin-like site-specific DNA recombinase
MKQAIIYTRFSPRPNAEDCESCEKQGERCRAYCELKGHQVDGYHADKEVSGGDLCRPGLQKAINALQDGYVLVVDRSDRLARDMLVNLTIRHEVARQGATIEYADGSMVADTPEGELFQNILAAFAAYERARIRDRLRKWAAKKKAKGEWMGKPPIGWQLDPENSAQLVEHVTERQAIARACILKQDGCYSAEIAGILTEEFGPCRGNPWSPRTVRRMIEKHAFWACPITGKPELEPSSPC